MHPRHVVNASGLKIAITHEDTVHDRVVILAPGFFTSKDTGTFRRMAADLKNSFDVIGMDFRGHGRSEGSYTFTAKEAEDLQAVVEYARMHYKKVGVLGFSYGGSVGVIQAAQYRNVDSLVCVGSPMASEEVEFRWWLPESFKLGILNFEWGKGVRPSYARLPKTRPIDVVASLSPIPVLFVHGDKDPTVDQRHSLRMYESARTPRSIRIFEGGSHAEDIYRSHPKEFIGLIQDWFLRTLA